MSFFVGPIFINTHSKNEHDVEQIYKAWAKKPKKKRIPKNKKENKVK